MKIVILIIITFCANGLFGQYYFDGLRHEMVGEIDYEVVEDTLFLFNGNTEVETGFDIILGQSKGFGFSFSAIDPILNENGAFQEWSMIGTKDEVENELLWKEKYQINNQNGLVRTDVYFDTSPIGAEMNGIELYRNDELVYQGNFEIGLLYSIEIDTSFVSALAVCGPRPITAKWDKTCHVIRRAYVQQNILLPDGNLIEYEENDILEIINYPINPQNNPTACSKVESRSTQIEKRQFYDEGIVMFEDRLPFYAIGDIIYETNAEFLRIFEIDSCGIEGVRIALDEAEGLDLNWEPITEPGKFYSLELSSEGRVNEAYQTLGKVKHHFDTINNEFLITADFSTFETESKIIQVVQNGELVEEFDDFLNNDIARLNSIPTGCGKFSQSSFGFPDWTVCYYFNFDALTDFEIGGNIFQGNEIRILSNTELPIEYLSEFSVWLADVPEIIITDVKPIATEINEITYENHTFSVFPNPFEEYVNISVDSDINGDFKYLLYNSNGMLVLSGDILDNQTSIETNSWMNGVYYLRIKDNKNSIYLPEISKIVKIK